ncbi:rhodanese-like domain-containing protein [Methylocaldum sp.]|uniref:rhodanese-like domain-containing protein n=1 Tax=Methylocaldum sp. TaxID=1969727 RepID=UPI002D3576E5|nr:rhodanese-like domain-containing protein [Methylocaldum sp.]HYE35569.1 rhodanese-like domain-containing protein [Methylocaldum sp.]
MPLTPMDLVAAAKQHIKEVNLEEAKALIGKAPILDVREPAEYAGGALPGAVNIPRGVLEFKIDSHPAFQNRRDAEILVYCQTGGRSALATEALRKLGYENAVSLAGGFKLWQESGRPVETPPSS